MRKLGYLGLAVAALLTASGAQAAGDPFIARFMGAALGKAKTFACFNRVYDPAHLTAHPEQNVKTMMLLAVVDPDSPDEIDLRIGVTFRTRNGMLETDGICASPHAEGEPSDATSAHCSVNCDGGAIDVELKANGSVLLGIPEGARLWKPGSDDPDANVRGAFGPDDKLFRLDRAALGQCLPLAVDKDEKASLLRAR
jgi:hypothetical protein